MTRRHREMDLYAASFAVTDLGLYLDTHPGDRAALAAFREAVEDQRRAKREWRGSGRDLTLTDGADRGGFSWIEGKAPWEGV